jgi:uncharacterized membrane protein YeaQ/YmgE (transglycosylase-associated protein family)
MPVPAIFRKVADLAGASVRRSGVHKRSCNARGMGRRSFEVRKDGPDTGGSNMSILGWLLIGLVAGALGKLIMPGKDPGGIIVTILIGIAGALLAKFLTPMMGIVVVDWTWQAFAAATLGAVILLAVYRLVMAKRTR